MSDSIRNNIVATENVKISIPSSIRIRAMRSFRTIDMCRIRRKSVKLVYNIQAFNFIVIDESTSYRFHEVSGVLQISLKKNYDYRKNVNNVNTGN